MEAAPLPWKSGFRWDPAGLSLPSEDGLQRLSYGAALRLKETVRGVGRLCAAHGGRVRAPSSAEAGPGERPPASGERPA